jgi:hypothetical protein
LSIVIPGYGLRIAERPMDSFSGLHFTELKNCIWCIIVTITTVGYGDYYATTNLGRIISILIMIDGVFVVSMFVVTLNSLLQMSYGEDKSFDYLNKLKAKDKLKKNAVRVFEQAYLKLRTEKSHPNNVRKLLGSVRDYRTKVLEFSSSIKGVR